MVTSGSTVELDSTVGRLTTRNNAAATARTTATRIATRFAMARIMPYATLAILETDASPSTAVRHDRRGPADGDRAGRHHAAGEPPLHEGLRLPHRRARGV